MEARIFMWRRKSFLWGLVFGIWTLFGLLAASQVYYDRAFVGRPIPVVKALAWQMSACYAIALCTPFVLWLARRFRVENRNWARRIAFHVLASFVFSTLISTFHIANDMLHIGGVTALTLDRFTRYLPVFFDRMVFVYWTILLLSHAYDYYMRYQNGLVRTANLEARLARAELDALKMQLNPHFLFNTLNAIAELIHRKPDMADEMVTQLSDMLRTTLEQTGVEEVTLKQELDFLERYLAIERTRMGSRLQIEMHIAPETLDARVPNMLLQPLVENAVKHGVAPAAAGGRITIEASRDNGSLRLNVLDTGRGLPAGWFENNGNGIGVSSVNRNSSSSVNKKSGVGLANTRARLAHLYGEGGSFDLRPANPHGVAVRIKIPFRESNLEHDSYHSQSLDR